MPAVGVLLVAVAACVAAYRARLRTALLTVIAVEFLVPDTLLVPRQFAASSYVTVSRVVILAFAIGILRRVARHEMPGSALRPRRLHLLLAVYCAVSFANGIAVAAPTTDIAPALHIWMGTVDNLVFFWMALAAIRAIDDDEWVAKALAGVLVVTALIAIGERFNHSSYAHWWFEGEPTLLNTVPAYPLETRGHGVRVRAADQFALAFGWLSVILLPVLLAVVPYIRSRLAVLARLSPALVVVAVLWSQSRSALLGLAGGVVAMLVLSRVDPRLTPYLLAGAVAAALAALLTTALSHPFSVAQSGSTSVRLQRLPIIFGETAARPYTGLGWTGLQVAGISTTDSSYLTIYGSLGVVGITTLFILLGTTVATVSGGLRAAPGRRRALAAGVVAAVLVAIAAPVAYDLFSQPSSTQALWLLAALGTALAERTQPRAYGDGEGAPRPALKRDWRARLAAPLLGIAIGSTVSLLAPVHYTATYRFDAVPFADIAAAHANESYIGEVMINSICASIAAQPLPGHATVTCRDLNAGPGTGEVKVSSPTAAGARAAEQATIQAASAFHGFRPYPLGAVAPGTPTGMRTAPVWLGMIGLALAVLVPFRVDRKQFVLPPARGPSGGARVATP